MNQQQSETVSFPGFGLRTLLACLWCANAEIAGRVSETGTGGRPQCIEHCMGQGRPQTWAEEWPLKRLGFSPGIIQRSSAERGQLQGRQVFAIFTPFKCLELFRCPSRGSWVVNASALHRGQNPQNREKKALGSKNSNFPSPQHRAL